ncbi:MAG: Hpt domain-containing protein [Selenomonadaceae bacterium]|nr:Hpt domain-containing protein [Selenomonadaceae bacterium]
MLTIEKLEEFGVDTKEGLTRCMNKETFYFRMITMGLSNDSFEKLDAAIKENNLDEAFEAAHALKGVLGNLALTPIYKPLSEMTEMLRAKKTADYAAMYKPIMEMRNQLLEMIKS